MRSKRELKTMIRQVIEEATKPNIGVDKSMLNEVIKKLTKIKEDKIDLRVELTPSQFDEFNKALNKIYTILD